MPEPTINNKFEQENPLEGNHYREVIENLAKDAGHFNANQLMHFVNSDLVEPIVKDAQEGKFTSERTNPDTGLKEFNMYSVDDIMAQFEIALQALDTSPDDPSWKGFIPRANGLRVAVNAVMSNKQLAEPFRLAVYLRQAEIIKTKDEGSRASGEVSPEILELHIQAAEDLGEEGVDAAGVSVEAGVARRMITEIPAAPERKETDPFDYLRQVLPPVTRPTIPRRPYDPNDRHIPTAEEKTQQYYDKFVNEENKQRSLVLLTETIKATPIIKEVLDKAGIPSSSMEAIDAIRENPDVRFEVAKILLKKLNYLADSPNSDMGWRIVSNSSGNLKSDPLTGKKYSSRDYAVSMALKMLGGEFSERNSDNAHARDKDGTVNGAQHRYAATQTMMSYYS